jgi:signal recognition particle receptor subunit beta
VALLLPSALHRRAALILLLICSGSRERERVKSSREQPQLQNRPLLVLANKQDVPNASHMSARHVADHV